MRLVTLLGAGAAVLGLTACGGGGGGGGSNSCSPGPTAAITISATGTSPTNACITPGGTVTFTNNDTAAHHDIEFDNSCATGGDIAPGAQKTVTFPTSGNCKYHDSNSSANAAFQGTVAVTTTTVSGGGY